MTVFSGVLYLSPSHMCMFIWRIPGVQGIPYTYASRDSRRLHHPFLLLPGTVTLTIAHKDRRHRHSASDSRCMLNSCDYPDCDGVYGFVALTRYNLQIDLVLVRAQWLASP